jgi:hypothetical protein
MTRTAIIAGRGALPAELAAVLPEPLVAALDGFPPAGLTPHITFRIERLMPFLRQMQDAGVTRVVFAGGITRPRLDPALFDPATAQVVPRLLAAIEDGDDTTLRAVIALFEDEGFTVLGVAEVAPGLIPGAGLLAGRITPDDERDATRAAAIVAALGSVDVGQGAVVQQGLCLGVETLGGTDRMLEQVAALPATLRPPGPRGVLYKAPKPGQDRRIDLPALGPITVEAAARAGLGGIAWAAGGVILLDRTATLAAAAGHGLFLWSREP